MFELRVNVAGDFKCMVEAIGATESQVRTAVMRAINKTALWVQSKSAREISEQKKIQLKLIRQKNIEKFKQVILYILTKVGAKPNFDQTVLYHLLYFIDFDYYELYEEQLMGLKYIKSSSGPIPVDFENK
jgi:hypothetical protein